MDRIDIHIEVPAINYKELTSAPNGESSENIRHRVMQSREKQLNRFKEFHTIYCNAHMTSKLIRRYCKIDESGNQLLRQAIQKLGLSARAYDRILKVSRTIADLEGEEHIQTNHLSEAIQYRSLDREFTHNF